MVSNKARHSLAKVLVPRTVCSPKPLARLRTNVGSLENCSSSDGFFTVRRRDFTAPRSLVFSPPGADENFSLCAQTGLSHEFLKIKISVTFCKAKRVHKLGQRVPRHQNVTSFWQICSLLLDRRSWSTLPVGQGIDVLFLCLLFDRRS